MLHKFAKFVAGLFVVGITVVLVIAIGLYFYVDTAKLTKIVAESVVAETGGKIEIEKIDFNAFTGLTIKNIRYSAPNIDGSASSNNSPFVIFNKIKLHYKLWSILYASLVIDAIEIEGGSIELVQDGNGWNFDGITKFRASLAPRPIPSEEPQKPSIPLANLIEDIANQLTIPLRVVVSNIGVKDLDFSLKMTKPNREIETISLSKFTTLVDITAFGKSIDIDVLIKANQIRYNSLAFDLFNTGFDIKITAEPTSKKLKLQHLDIQILDHLKVGLKAGVWSEKRDTNKLGYDFELNTSIDASIAQKFKKFLPPTLTTEGKFAFDIHPLKGLLDLDTINDEIQAKNFSKILPESIKTSLGLQSLKLQDSAMGLDVKPINLALDMEVISEDKITKAKLKLRNKLDGISFAPTHDLTGKNIQVGRTELELNASVAYPLTNEFATNLELKIDEVSFKNNKIDPISTPIGMTLTANGSEDLSKIQSEIALAIGEILQSKLNAHCSQMCEQFDVEAGLELPSLNKIWQLAKVNIARNVIPKFQPENVEGKYLFTSKLKGTMPNPLKTDPKKLINQLKFKSLLSSELRELSLKLPFNNTSLEKNNLLLQIAGSERQQNLELAHNFSHIRTILPSQKKSPPVATVIGFNWDTQLEVQLPPLSQLPKSRKIPVLKLGTKLNAKEIAISQLFKQPFKDVNFKAGISTNQSQSITVENTELNIPDFSTSLKVKANSKIGDNFTPQSFFAGIEVSLDKFPQQFVNGIQASGAFKGNFELFSEDMESATFSGNINLDNINALIADVDTSKPPKFVLEDLKGSIPMRHTFALAPLLTEKGEAKSNEEPNATESSSSFNKTVNINADEIKKATKNYLDKIKPPTIGDTSIALSEDYSNFKDFFPGRRSISIRKIAAAGFEFEGTEIDLELSQNKFSVNNFITKFLGGKIHGETQVFFDEKPVSIKSSVHLTRLNTENLIKNVKGLKSKARGFISGGNPYLDGAIHLQYNLRTSDMSGGVDITSIGKDQLRMIMYYIDPTDSDTSISAIKTALNFGEVKFVSVPIKNGEIGVEVDIRLLAAPIPTPKLHGFPIAKLISNFQNQDSVENESSH